jgi:site-specific recombinase XerD
MIHRETFIERLTEVQQSSSSCHTAVSLLKDAGVPDAVVMALVGHESLSHRYTHVGKEALARAAKTFPEI